KPSPASRPPCWWAAARRAAFRGPAAPPGPVIRLQKLRCCYAGLLSCARAVPFAHEVLMRLRLLTTVLVLLFVPFISLHAQTRTEMGGITGSVVDPDGRAIMAATVIVRNDSNGQTQALSTDSTGKFAVPALAAGAYTIEVSAPGMALERRAGVKVVAGQSQD